MLYIQLTDLDSLIGNNKSKKNLRIFLNLTFYMKSILVILKPLNLPFWPFVDLWILNFWIFLTFSKFKATKIVKWQLLTFWNQPKWISCKIRVAGTLLKFLTVKNPQSKFPIRLLRSVLYLQLIYVYSLFHFLSRYLMEKRTMSTWNANFAAQLPNLW